MKKEEVIEYLKEHELVRQNAAAAFIACDLAFVSYLDFRISSKSYFSPHFSYMSHNHSHIWYQITSRRLIKEVSGKIYHAYLKNPKNIKGMIENHKNLISKTDNIWKRYKLLCKKGISDNDFLKIFKDFVVVSKKWWKYAVIGEDKYSLVYSKTVKNFQEKHNLSKAKAHEFTQLLSHPKEESLFVSERRDFLGVSLYASENKGIKKSLLDEQVGDALRDNALKKKIEAYIKKYFWIRTNFYTASKVTPLSLLKDVKNKVSENSTFIIRNELKKVDYNLKKFRIKQNEITSRLKLSGSDKTDMRFAQISAYWIDQRKVGMMKNFYYFFSMLRDMAKRFNMDYDTLTLYTLEEAEKLLKNRKKVDKRKISKRSKNLFIVYEKNKGMTFFYGNDAKKLFEVSKHAKHKDKLKGMVASRTKSRLIKGIARIVSDPSKEKFHKNEILVTSMTRVEFVPVMRNAKAIITDEGGITSHAAIVSRELSIPCIVGTKHATHTLKNGMTVEMDMNTGTIRVLK